MEKKFCCVLLIAVFFFGLSGLEVSAEDLTGELTAVIDLDGLPLGTLEMNEIFGGLPRCCHDPEYDPIEDKCLNNKGQRYKEGVNDCDIWVETVLKQAGTDISNQWGSASSTSVAGHVKILSDQLLDQPPLGWSIEIIDDGHVALVRVKADGSADLYHQGLNRRTPTTEKWEGSRGYQYRNSRNACWGNRSRFWDFDR